MARRWRRAAGVGLAVGLGMSTPAQAQPDSIVRVQVESLGELEALQELGLDVLTEWPQPGWISVRVPGQRRAMVAASGLQTQTIVEDLDARVVEQRLRLDLRPSADETAVFFDDFRDFDEIGAHLDALVADWPDLVEVSEIGRSLEDRPLRAVKITNAPEDAPTVLIQSGQHAREWIAVMSGVCAADSLATRSAEPEISALLDEVQFVVVPVVNPDGYVYSWQTERFWRKNRRDGVGVDTNRNFGTGWGGPGSSGNPNKGNYRGTEAFSEPETAAIRNLAAELGDVRAFLDVHSFGQLVLRPWGHVDEDPPDHDVLLPLSETMAARMTDPFGTEYTPLAGTDFYPAAGNAQDWGYGALGAMSFTLELRPQEVEQFELGFVLPPERIEDVCLETMAAVLELGLWAASSAPGSPGDTGDFPMPQGTSTGPDGSTGVVEPAPTPDPGGTTDVGTSGAGTTGVDPSTTGSADETSESSTDEGCTCRSTRSNISPALMLVGIAGLSLTRRRRRRRAIAGH